MIERSNRAMHYDGGAWLAGVAGAGDRPHFAALHTSPKSVTASMNA